MMRRVSPRVLVPVLAALTLAGCGFRPMLAESTGVAPRLSGISVETSEGRPGYLVGVALRDRLGIWQGEQARYVLRTRAATARLGTALTINQVASRVLLQLTVAYGLYDLESGELLTQGSVLGQASYDLPAQPYAGIRAELDASERAAQDAANRTVLALGRYFTNQDAELAEAAGAAAP